MANKVNKHSEVQRWLESLFGEEIIPKYEVNDYTISFLYSLYIQNKELNRLTNIAIEDLKQRIEEYKIEEDRIQDTLNVFGIPVSSFSNAGKQSIKTLADLAAILNLKDTSKTYYLIAITMLMDECKETDNTIKNLNENIDSLLQQFRDINNSIAAINKCYSSLIELSYNDGLMTEKRRNETLQMKAKAEKYGQQIEDFKVANKFVDKKYHHESLIELSKGLEVLKKELIPLESKLKTFKSLPSDLNLAKVKIEEARRELEKLESELQVDIDLIAL